MLKKALKYLFRFVVFLVCFILAYALADFALSRITVHKEPNEANDITIYIKTNGVHTDIVVPLKNDVYDWSKQVLFANTNLTDSTAIQWLAMGWGDKGFYLETPTWADLKFSTAFKAAFALSNTAMHATFYSRLTEDAHCKKIMIGKAQYERLVNYIDDSFDHDDSGQVIVVKTNANYNNADAFYEASGHYSLFKTCNTWANTCLKKCGQKACFWTAMDKGIFWQYK